MPTSNILLPISLTRKIDSEIIKDKFRVHYTNGIIKPISIDDIPASPMGVLEESSRRFSEPGRYFERDFKQAYVIIHGEGDKTYVVRKKKIYDIRYGSGMEEFFFLTDVDVLEKAVTSAELRYCVTNQKPYFKNKPFVEHVGMSEDSPFSFLNDFDEDSDIMEKIMRKTSMQKWVKTGMRELNVMNALSLAFFSLPAYSNINIFDETTSLWKELENKGFASSFLESKMNVRYQFNHQPEIYGYNRN